MVSQEVAVVAGAEGDALKGVCDMESKVFERACRKVGVVTGGVLILVCVVFSFSSLSFPCVSDAIIQ